jgi:hypothetical protein
MTGSDSQRGIRFRDHDYLNEILSAGGLALDVLTDVDERIYVTILTMSRNTHLNPEEFDPFVTAEKPTGTLPLEKHKAWQTRP